jgi:N-acetylglucosamine kinase-like BadF-type ATPase
MDERSPRTHRSLSDADEMVALDATNMHRSDIRDALAFVDHGPVKDTDWANLAYGMTKHCQEGENMDMAAARILARAYRELMGKATAMAYLANASGCACDECEELAEMGRHIVPTGCGSLKVP